MPTIDLSDAKALQDSLIGWSPARIAGVLTALGTRAVREWQRLAPNAKYRAAVKIIKADSTEVTVGLVGALANMQEQGAPPFDMRLTLLRPGASGVKTSKAGHRYRTIPVRGQLRTISTNSARYRDANGKSWQHPGFRGLNILDQVAKYIEAQIALEVA